MIHFRIGSRRGARTLLIAAMVGLSACGNSPTGTAGTPTPTPVGPPAGGSSGTSLTFLGPVSDTLTSASVVCYSASDSLASGKFFFDIVGTTTGGQHLIFSGAISGYNGPNSYNAPAESLLLTVGSNYFVGHQLVGLNTGTIVVSSGGTSGSFANVNVPHANPQMSGTEVVNGTFACISYTKPT